MDIRKETLNFSLYSFFLYLSNATMCIDEEAKEQVWNDMAYKLIEWNDVSRDELRVVFREFGAQFDEMCHGCNEFLPIIEEEYEGNPLCAECKIASGEYCPADCDCTHCLDNSRCECGDCVNETKNCICGTMTKDILCKMCEIKALETPMSQFLEVEEIMDKSYDGLYGYPTTAFLQNYGTLEGFRRISRSSHSLFGKYRIEKMTAYIETQKKL